MRKEVHIDGMPKTVYLLQTWHLILIIIFMACAVATSFGIAQYRIGQLEIRQTESDVWQHQHDKLENDIMQRRDTQYYEIQINLRTLLEKNGLVYQQLSK